MSKRRMMEDSDKDRDIEDLIQMVNLLERRVDVLEKLLEIKEEHEACLENRIEKYRRKLSVRVGIKKWFMGRW